LVSFEGTVNPESFICNRTSILIKLSIFANNGVKLYVTTHLVINSAKFFTGYFDDMAGI